MLKRKVLLFGSALLYILALNWAYVSFVSPAFISGGRSK